MIRAKIRKNVYPCKPQLYYVTCFPDVPVKLCPKIKLHDMYQRQIEKGMKFKFTKVMGFILPEFSKNTMKFS